MPIYHWDIEQRTLAWDRIRCGKLTGSRVDDVMSEPWSKADKDAGLLSASATKMMDRCISEAFTGVSEFIRPTWEMERGQQLEPEARAAFEEAIGLTASTCGFVQYDDAGPLQYFGFSPDALVLGGPAVIPVEIKCPTVDHARTVRLIADGAEPWDCVPAAYHSQLMAGQLCCHGPNREPAPYSYYVSYDPRWPVHKLAIVKVPSLIDDIEKMIFRVSRWCEMLCKTLIRLDEEVAK